MLYGNRGIVPEADYEVPFGHARQLNEGSDITIVGISHMVVVECLRAAQVLKDIGISAEVIDPVTLAPLDIDAIMASVRKTGHLLIVDTSWTMCGAGSEIIARIVEEIGEQGIPKMKRMGYAPAPCPTTRPLEDIYYPNGQTIAEAAHQLLRSGTEWSAPETSSSEVLEFRGPF